MKDYVKRFLNVQGIVSLLMIVVLFIKYYKTFTSKWVPNAFSTAEEYGFMWIIIILAFLPMILSIIVSDLKTKSAFSGIISASILVLNVITSFFWVGDSFKARNLGWWLMNILCIIQVVYGIYHNKNEVGEIVSDQISKI